jgi:hypothetical protein
MISIRLKVLNTHFLQIHSERIFLVICSFAPPNLPRKLDEMKDEDEWELSRSVHKDQQGVYACDLSLVATATNILSWQRTAGRKYLAEATNKKTTCAFLKF